MSKKLMYNYDEDRKKISKTQVNTEYILDQTIEILECMATDEMKQLKKSNKKTYVEVMENKFKDFADKYYSLFRVIINGDDITPLFTMLDGLDSISSGEKSLEVVEKNIGKELSKFLPNNIKKFK